MKIIIFVLLGLVFLSSNFVATAAEVVSWELCGNYDADQHSCREPIFTKAKEIEANINKLYFLTTISAATDEYVYHAWLYENKKEISAKSPVGYFDAETRLSSSLTDPTVEPLKTIVSAASDTAQQLVMIIRLPIKKSPSFRTVSCKQINPKYHLGGWKVMVISQTGKVLDSKTFRLIEAEVIPATEIPTATEEKKIIEVKPEAAENTEAINSATQ